MAADLEITWGSLVLGGSSTVYVPISGYSHSEDRAEGDASFAATILVTGTTDANHRTNVNALITGIGLFNQSLTVTFNGQTMISWSHSSNTGYNTVGTCVQDDTHDANGRLSSVWQISFSATYPASQREGRRSGAWAVAYDVLRIRTVTISAVFTALSSNSALATWQASSGMDAFCDIVKSLLAISVWKKMTDTLDSSDDGTARTNIQSKELVASRVYVEVPSWHDGPLLSETFRGVTLSVSASETGGPFGMLPDGTRAYPELPVTVTFSGLVLPSVTTDLESIYQNTVVPYMLSKLEETLGSSLSLILTEEKDFDPPTNSLSAVITGKLAQQNGIIGLDYSSNMDTPPTIMLVPIADGDPDVWREYTTPRIISRGQTLVVTSIPGAPVPSLDSFDDTPPMLAGYKRVSSDGRSSSQSIIQSSRGSRVYVVTSMVRSSQYYKAPTAPSNEEDSKKDTGNTALVGEGLDGLEGPPVYGSTEPAVGDQEAQWVYFMPK